MPMRKLLFSLTLAFLVVANCVAQEETKTEHNPKASQATARAIANTTKQMMKRFAAVELTDEQKEKATGIVEKHIASLMEAKQALDGLLSDEQKEKRKAGVAKAKAEGVKGSKVYAAGIEAMGLSEEDAKKFEAAKKKLYGVSGKIQGAITALLTEEQKSKMPVKKAKRNKQKMAEGDDVATTQTVSLKLPGMT